jgi:kinesin family protein 5
MDSIRVVCRVRPAHEGEDEPVVQVSDDCRIKMTGEEVESTFFVFDRVFAAGSSQEEVYLEVGRPLVQEMFRGLNVTILAYGQTSSGKTFTMQGYGTQQGIVPRLVKDLFAQIVLESSQAEFTVRVSVLEIYVERLRDLLDPESDKDLRIR